LFFNFPTSICCDNEDPESGILFVADCNNHTIRKITSDGTVTTLCGSTKQSGTTNGSEFNAQFNNPKGICCDNSGIIFICDHKNHTIRNIFKMLWTPKTHNCYSSFIKKQIITVMTLSLKFTTTNEPRYPEIFFYKLSKDTLFTIFQYLANT